MKMTSASRYARARLVLYRIHCGGRVSPGHRVPKTPYFILPIFFASRRHTAEDRISLDAAHKACARVSRRKDPEPFYTANKRFHEAIYRASHNSYLEEQTINLRNRLEAYRRAATFHAGLIAATMLEHERILKAILAMDEAAAGTLMRSHLDTLQNDAVSMAKALALLSPSSATD